MIDDFIVPLPLQFFKLGKLAELDVAKKIIKIVSLLMWWQTVV